MLKLLFFTSIVFYFTVTFTIQPVSSQGLLESIRNGIQNVIRPRQEKNRETRVANNSTPTAAASNKNNNVQQSHALSPSHSMAGRMRNAIHYPVFVPDSSLTSSSWMSGSSRVPLSSESIVPSVDYTTSSSGSSGSDSGTRDNSNGMWPNTESPFGMEVYEEDQLLAHKDSLRKRHKANAESSHPRYSTSPATSSHHTRPFQSPEYSSSEENSQPSLPEVTHHSTHESVTDDGRPRSIMYNSPPFGASSRSTSYIDHSIISPVSSASSSSSSETAKSSVHRHYASSSSSPGTTSPLMSQLFDSRSAMPMAASNKLPYWADATLLSPETTTSSLYPSAAAAFTTTEALARAELL